MSQKNKIKIKMIMLHMFFIIICFFTLLPITYAFIVSINENNSLVSSIPLSEMSFTIKNYINVFIEKDLSTWFLNTLLLAISTVTLALTVSIPAAYAFSRKKFKGRKTILKIIIILNAFPSILSMFAIYRLLTPLGLVNNRFGLILVYTGTMSIFGLWNLKGYFDTVPYEIEEAAIIDGASELQLMGRILVPLAKPAIVVTAIMVLIYVWNEYLYAVTFLTGEEKYTLAGGLYSLQAGEMSGSWPMFAAASLIVSLPILIIFLCVQKYMVSGLSAGGVKG